MLVECSVPKEGRTYEMSIHDKDVFELVLLNDADSAYGEVIGDPYSTTGFVREAFPNDRF
jgi:ribosomal protein S6E (S10)